jgi:hypothetical protein
LFPNLRLQKPNVFRQRSAHFGCLASSTGLFAAPEQKIQNSRDASLLPPAPSSKPLPRQLGAPSFPTPQTPNCQTNLDSNIPLILLCLSRNTFSPLLASGPHWRQLDFPSPTPLPLPLSPNRKPTCFFSLAFICVHRRMDRFSRLLAAPPVRKGSFSPAAPSREQKSPTCSPVTSPNWLRSAKCPRPQGAPSNLYDVL